MDFSIVSDSSCNLLEETIDEFDITILPLTFMVDGEQYASYVKGRKTDLKQFYDMIRDGKTITTSLPNIQDSERSITELLDKGRDVLYIGFSSGLSGTYEATSALLEELKKRYPERKIYHVDTFGASLGEGLLVYKAACMARDGASIEETYQWVLDNRFHLAHWFTVDKLEYLWRGGRVSRSSAWAGDVLNIKPVMHMDDAGHLIPVYKVRGRKKSILGMFDHMVDSAIEPIGEQTVFITHGDCEDDAKFLADKIRQKWGNKDIRWNYVDPVIGAHCGPGTLALFFLAQQR